MKQNNDIVFIKPIRQYGRIQRETVDDRGEPLIYVIRHDNCEIYVCREYEIDRETKME